MKAFVVDHYGPDGLRPADIPTPTPGPGDVLVDIRAASINPLDRMVRDGQFKQTLHYRPPFVLGHDVAGVITEVGPDATGFQVGDPIFARPRDLRIGTFADTIAIAAADIARKPDSLTVAEAAAVPLVALAAWQALVDVAGVQPGQKVLVHGGAGGLGSTVLQLAKHLGATVATTAHTRDLDRVHTLGADVAIDYTSQDFANELHGYDLVLDSLGGPNLEKSLTVLRPGGLAISVAGPPDRAFAAQLGQPLLAPIMALMSRSIRRRAKRLGVRYRFLFMHSDGAQLAHLAALYDAGSLQPVLDRTFDFDHTLQAMAYVENGHARGKVVITH